MTTRLTRLLITAFYCLPVLAFGAVNNSAEKLLADSTLSGALIGIKIFDISADSVIYEHQSDKLLTPASNLKLFTSAAALELLGPSFRFKTSFYSRGKIDKKGRLNGDLLIVGGGDPLISGRFRSRVTEVLELWADSLKSRGINEIGGNLIADNSLFPPPTLGPGWSWDDLSYWYACQISALSFNDNCVDLKYFPGINIGNPARIELNPSTKYISVVNNAVTLPAESSFTLDYYRSSDGNRVTFFGGIPSSDSEGRSDYVSVYRPELFTLSVFSEILKNRGLKLQNQFSALSDMKTNEAQNYNKDKLAPIFTWQSDSLGVVLKVINTNSQNFFAEQTLRMVGVEKNNNGTFQGGIKAEQRFFDSIGITERDIQIYDGSGLSYMNHVKPDAIIKLLSAMSKCPNFKVYYESLANPDSDRAAGTRLKGVSARGNVRFKGGYIAGVSTLSGYIRGPKSGHLLAFSIMINNYTCANSYAEDWEDSLLAAILSEF
jgi:D-alanyl-D-alanine carboxypeptidase/D-alanyl-D-alanine-endopeptidase (penicillin-binding protein 4)